MKVDSKMRPMIGLEYSAKTPYDFGVCNNFFGAYFEFYVLFEIYSYFYSRDFQITS